jgi:hypothetical protein
MAGFWWEEELKKKQLGAPATTNTQEGQSGFWWEKELNRQGPRTAQEAQQLFTQQQQQREQQWRQRQENLANRAMQGWSDISAPLQIPGQLSMGLAEDIGNARLGRPATGAFARNIRNIPATLVQPLHVLGINLADRPKKISSGADVLEAWGKEDAPLWMQIGVEIALDPLMFGTMLMAGGKVLNATGKVAQAAKMQNLGQQLRKAGFAVEDVGRGVDSAISLGGLGRGSSTAVKAVTGVDPTEVVAKKFFEIMETPSPFRIPDSKRYTQPWVRSGDPIAQEDAQRMLNYTWGEIFFPHGITPGAPASKTGMAQTKTESEGVIHGVMHRIKLANQRIEETAQNAVGSVRVGVFNPANNIREGGGLIGGIGKAWEGLEKGVKGKRVIPKEEVVIATKLKEIAGSWLDNLSTTADDTVQEILATPKLARASRKPDAFAAQTKEIVGKSAQREAYIERAKALARVYVAPELKGLSESQAKLKIAQAESAFSRAVIKMVEEGYKTTLSIGAQLSQWETKFEPIVRKMAQRLGRPYESVIADLVKEAQNPKKLAEFLTGEIPKPKEVLALPSAGPPQPKELPITTPRSIPDAERWMALQRDMSDLSSQRGGASGLGSRTGLSMAQIAEEMAALQAKAKAVIPTPTIPTTPALPPAPDTLPPYQPNRARVYTLPEEPRTPEVQRRIEQELLQEINLVNRQQGRFVALGDQILPPIPSQTPAPTLTEKQIERIQAKRAAEMQQSGRMAAKERAMLYARRQKAFEAEKQAEKMRLEALEKARQDYAKRMAEDLEYRKREPLAAAFHDAARELGFDDFATISPFEYIRGLQNGYLRRVYNFHSDPEAVRVKVRRGDIGIVRAEASIDDIAEAARTHFGPDSEKAVLDFIRATPSPAVSASDISSIIQRTTGAEPDIEKVRDFIRAVNPDAKVMDEILQRLEIKTNEWKALGEKPALGLQRQAFSQRVVNDPYVRALLQENEDIKSRLAALGQSGGRALSSQVVMQHVYDTLKTTGHIVDKQTFYANGGRIDNLRFVLLPDDTETWGGLAGKAIPQFYARVIASGMSYDGMNSGLGAFGKIAAGIRAGYLSAPGTATTNIWGNFALMQSAGVPVDEVLAKMPKAFKAIREYAETGYAKDFEGAEDFLRFLSDGTLSRELAQTISEAYEATLGVAKKKDFPTKFNEFMTRIAKTAPFGTLHAFQFVEDWQRASVYMWAKDRMLSKAAVRGEAIDLDKIVRDAAFFSNNALYDYGNVGAGLDWLRRSGLGVFPTYAYFSVGRTIDNIVNHPGRVATIEHAISAANSALANEEERAKIDRIWIDAQGHGGRYLAVPGDNPSSYYLIDLSKYLPMGVMSQTGMSQLFIDPLTGGLFRPLIEIGLALQSGTGEAAWSKQYGKRVFYPHQTGLEKLGSTMNFLMESYQPAPMSWIERWASRREVVVNEEQARRIEQITGNYLGVDMRQMIASYFGVRTKEVDTKSGGITTRSAIANEARDINALIRSINAEYQERLRRGEPLESISKWYQEQIRRVVQERARDVKERIR